MPATEKYPVLAAVRIRGFPVPERRKTGASDIYRQTIGQVHGGCG